MNTFYAAVMEVGRDWLITYHYSEESALTSFKEWLLEMEDDCFWDWYCRQTPFGIYELEGEFIPNLDPSSDYCEVFGPKPEQVKQDYSSILKEEILSEFASKNLNLKTYKQLIYITKINTYSRKNCSSNMIVEFDTP